MSVRQNVTNAACPRRSRVLIEATRTKLDPAQAETLALDSASSSVRLLIAMTPVDLNAYRITQQMTQRGF